MGKRNRNAEARRAARQPRVRPGWQYAPVGVVVQTEQTWADYEAQRQPDDEPEVPTVLACPGCTDRLVQCGDHGRCAEHGCWTDGLSREPVFCRTHPRRRQETP